MLFPNNFQSINYGLEALLSWGHFHVAESYCSSFPLHSCISLKHNLGDICAKRLCDRIQPYVNTPESHFPQGKY